LRLNFFKSLHLKLGVFYAVIFCVSITVFAFIVSVSTQNFLLAQLRAHAESGASQLLNDYYQDGITELRHDIKERVDAEDPERLWYFLTGPNGTSEFDEIDALPEAGWHQIENHGHHMLLLVTPLNEGFKLGVGVGLDRLIAVEKALQRAFLWAILALLGLSAAGGYVVSRSVVRRFDRFKTATTSFGEGDLKNRISRDGSMDEFDQLAATLNSMFERIETLVAEVQRVTSNIAHDLRTPLGRVKQKIETLAESASDPQIRNGLEETSQILDGTLTTFSALMRIAEVELGTRRAEFQRFDVCELFDNIRDAYEAAVEEGRRSIQFECEVERPVLGDRALMMQALVNLIENGLQHTPERTHIVVRAGQLSSKDYEIVISDNGPGIPVAERENVLKPFFKLDRSRGAGGGNGLGLSLVAAVARLHDAELSIEDANPGTRVRWIVREK